MRPCPSTGGAGGAKQTSSDPDPERDEELPKLFKPGDLVRENRQGAPWERVAYYNHPMVATEGGNYYHHTKVVKHEGKDRR